MRRIAEEANYFDAVLDSMNQVQNALEALLAEINGFDAFDSQVERVEQELAVSRTLLLFLLSINIGTLYIHFRISPLRLYFHFNVVRTGCSLC